MADTKVSALTALSATPATNDRIPLVDVSDTSMSASGTTKYMTAQNMIDLALAASQTWTGQNTYAAGTITTSQPLTISSTLNSAGVTFEGLLIDWTDTASAAGSMPINVKVGGSSKFKVDKSGLVITGSNGSASSPAFAIGTNGGLYSSSTNRIAIAAGGSARLEIASVQILGGNSMSYGWASSSNPAGGSPDTAFNRNGAGIIEINNGTVGSYRDLVLRNLLASGGNGSYIQTPSMTVANLAAAATAGAGARAFVTDATATTFLSTVAGGGANKVPVVSDGTNWLIG